MLKEVLEYNEDELRELSKDNLDLLLQESIQKENLYNVRQLVEKTLINGLYGALANQYFPLFNEDIAAAITANGRFFIQKLANYIEEHLQSMHKADKPYIVYGDTDSVYFHIEQFVEMYKDKNPGVSLEEQITWADNFEQKIIQPVIQKCIDDFSTELNAYDVDAIGCEREIISDTAVFTAKKKYYARVRDSEGTLYPIDDPYIKVMGLELIKSTTPTFTKKYLKEAIPLILDGTDIELREWINSIKSEFLECSLLDICGSGGVNNLDYNLEDDISKGIVKSVGIPIGARATLVHNRYITKINKTDIYTSINSGDRVKKIFLQEPNPLGSNIVAFTNDNFIEEIKDYIDYDTNFEKNFLAPLQIMTNALKWDLNKETGEIDDW